MGTVSDEELSASRYQQKIAAVKVAAAEANVASKEAHLAQLRALLPEGAVRAPFDGTVTARYADVGALIHKGAPIVRMIESGELRVRFAIPEEEADALAVGDPVRIVAGELHARRRRREDRSRDRRGRANDLRRGLARRAAASRASRIRSGQVARVPRVDRRAGAARRRGSRMCPSPDSSPFRARPSTYHAGEQRDGALLRLSPRWTRWSYWLLLATRRRDRGLRRRSGVSTSTPAGRRSSASTVASI